MAEGNWEESIVLKFGEKKVGDDLIHELHGKKVINPGKSGLRHILPPTRNVDFKFICRKPTQHLFFSLNISEFSPLLCSTELPMKSFHLKDRIF